jgi:hypothetical protein
MTHINDSVKAPVRSGNGWRILHHELYQIAPDQVDKIEGLPGNPSVWETHFGQDLFLAENKSAELMLDVGWSPDGDPNGVFYLQLLRTREGETDWEHPLEVFKTRDLSELLKQLDRLLKS